MLTVESKLRELFCSNDDKRKGMRFNSFMLSITTQVDITNGAVKAGIFAFIACIITVERTEPIMIAIVVEKLKP